eukprot:scaffold13781_cov126-Skeletonema_dohrnii-CCMP3373.AAC.2
MFRPLALATAFAGSTDAPDTVGVQLASKIAAPGSKDLILLLSSEINLVTQTAAKDQNKGGNKDTSEAFAQLAATLKYCVDCPGKTIGTYDSVADAICNGGSGDVYTALPGPITFAARRQTLSVEVNLDCAVEVEDDPDATCEVTGYVKLIKGTLALEAPCSLFRKLASQTSIEQ